MKEFRKLIDTAAEAAALGFPLGEDARIYTKEGKRCYVTRKGCDLSHLTAENILDITGSNDPIKTAFVSSKWQSMILSRPPYCGRVIREDGILPAVLDDCAQIIGLTTPLVASDRFAVMRALRRHTAVLLEDETVLTCGRDLYEAVTALSVLEKNAEIYCKAEVFGGAHFISPIPGILEHLFYLKKYSKAERRKQREL